MNIDTLFNPKSVAVIGADDRNNTVGYALMKNILAGGTREIYPITLNKAEVMGHVAYKSVVHVAGSIDLAVIAIRANFVPDVLRECAEKGIKHVVLISAGFKEMGDNGKALEEEVATIAQEHGIALLGPNCLGIMSTQDEWNASFAVNSPQKGGIAFVSQSGALGTALLDWANREGVGFSKFVSLGNEAVLNELDFMEYLIDDPDTTAVLLYLEQVSDGTRFMELAREITNKKPLVVLRAGRSARGSAAVASHTGSLAPSDAIFKAALKQAGAIPVESIRTLFSLTKLFQLGYTTPLQRLAILTNGGGPSVNTADLIDFSHTLSLSTFDDVTQEGLKAVLPPMAAVGNPIDVIGDSGPDRYDGCLTVLTALKDVDAIIALVTPQMMTDPKGIAEVLVQHKDSKPIIPVFMGGDTVTEGVAHLHEAGQIAFDSPADVIVALDALALGHEKQPTEGPDTEAPRLSTHLEMLPLDEMQQILYDYDLPLAGEFVADKSDIEKALKKLGDGPYAMKAISQQLVHKSDLQAVKLHLADATAIEAAWDDITTHVGKHTEGATIDGMLIQRMVSGVECIIGMKRDKTFGPVIVFGLGGIFVEVLKDASMRVAPVSKEEARKQIEEIKGYPLLTGARGTEPVNVDALAEAVAALSHLALDYPNIEEVDFNPIFATKDGIKIVDARLMRRKEESSGS